MLPRCSSNYRASSVLCVDGNCAMACGGSCRTGSVRSIARVRSPSSNGCCVRLHASAVREKFEINCSMTAFFATEYSTFTSICRAHLPLGRQQREYSCTQSAVRVNVIEIRVRQVSLAFKFQRALPLLSGCRRCEEKCDNYSKGQKFR